MFFKLGCMNLKASKKRIKGIDIKLREKVTKVNGIETGIGSRGAVKINEFLVYFNKYVKWYNKTTNKQNLISAYGYFLASGTACLSLLLEFLT